jgi:hypothetical protein
MKRYRAALLVAWVCSWGAAGCGGERLYDVSGTVSYNGTPVPTGLVFFDPDPTQDPGGTQGFAEVHDGKFNTAVGGRGVRGGHYTVRILGYDGKASNELPKGHPLFSEHQEKRELPQANSELTFDLPGSKK